MSNGMSNSADLAATGTPEGVHVGPSAGPQVGTQAVTPVPSAGARPVSQSTKMPKEIGGPPGPEPTRYGDWQYKGRCTDF